MSAEMVSMTGPTAVELSTLADEAKAYAESSRAEATMRGYRSDWRQFANWCAHRDVVALPGAPEVVAMYVADLAGVKAVGTIQRHLTSISQAHARAGYESPTKTEPVRRVWAGVRRTFGTASKGKAPLLTDDVRAMVGHLTERPLDIRDRALILIMFAGALRRSEAVALNVEDIEVTDDGLLVTIRRSKTDQEGKGHVLGLPFGSDRHTCPVRALRRHLEVNSIEQGAVFRSLRTGQRLSGRAAATRVQRLATLIGRDVTTIGAHSLRAGLITAAVTAGVSEHNVMRHSRHKSITVFRTYVRGLDAWDDNAAAAVGL